MANVHRWRYYDTDQITCAVDATTVIEIGDFLGLVTDDARPASSFADLGTEAANQEAFHDVFLGVALQAHRSTDPAGDIVIATAGVFEFIAASATYQPGAFVGVDEDGAGTALLDQTVAAVATANLAVGRVVKLATSATRVLVEIVSTVIRGGPQSLI